MLVAGFSQFHKTCFSTKTLLFCSGLPQPRIWGQRRYWFWFRARPGDWSLWGRLSIRRELWRVLGRPLDPLGTRALFGMLLGALNMGLHC
jgi:hypothetical protein